MIKSDSSIAIPGALRRRFKAWAAERGLHMTELLVPLVEALISGAIKVKIPNKDTK